MSIALNIIGGIIAGLIATFIYQWIRRPRLEITLCPQKELAARNDSWVSTQHVRVTNCEPPLLRRFLRRNDAHSCYAWVILHNPPIGSGSWFCRGSWLPVYRPPHSLTPRNIAFWLPSREIAREFADIGSGGAAEIAIAKKPWARRFIM